MKKIIKVFKQNSFYWKGAIEPANVHEKKRSASWLELFIDLVFVSSLGLLVHGMVINPSIFGLLTTIIYFLVIWNSWFSITMYSHLFEQRGILHKCVMFINLLAAVFILIPYTTDYTLYISEKELILLSLVALLGSRLIMFLTWNMAYKKNYNKFLKIYLKKLSKVYLISFLIVMISTIVVLFLKDINLFLQSFTLFIVLNELRVVYFQIENKNLDRFFIKEHIVERFGLFTMLIVGESILAVINNIHSITFSGTHLLIMFLYLLMIFLLWFLYYELSMNKSIKCIRKWMYSQLFVQYSFLMIAIATNISLEGNLKSVNFYFYFSIILYFISLLILRKTLDFKKTLVDKHLNINEVKVYNVLRLVQILSIILFFIIFIISFNSLSIVLALTDLILIFNIVTYYYYYIEMMNNILW